VTRARGARLLQSLREAEAAQVGGAGVVMRFRRVRPRRIGGLQPHKAQEITPRFLDRTIRALKRWKYDIVTMDEVSSGRFRRPSRSRFAALTFDDATRI